MSNLTERAIRESFIKLLNEKPLSQISVRMIVEDCGINRNSFYYHYHDIPTLIENIIKDEVNSLIAKYPTVESLNDSIAVVFQYIAKNKKAVWHIYDSVNRDIYEKYLMKICGYMVENYIDTAFGKDNIPEKDRETAIRFFKCELFGLSFEWIMNGMSEDVEEQVYRITNVCKGLSDDLISRINRTE